METVNNIASAASKAIWGDSTQHATGNETVANTEPLSGVKGNVEAGEPYDKGNEEPVNTASTTEHSSTTAPPSTTEHTSTLGSSSTTEHTSTLGSASTTAPKETSLPTNLNYQKNTDGTIQPEVNPKTRLADDVPAPSTTTSNPMSNPATDTNTPSTTAEFEKSTTKPIEKDTQTTTDTTTKSDEPTEQANLKKQGIMETKGEGDHAPKFDTFKTAGGPHIDDVKSDGRVGPDIPKGDLKDFEEREEVRDEQRVGGEGVTGHKHHDAVGSSEVKKDTSAVGSEDSVDSAGKEKVSLKDKIKAKLHKH